MQKTFYYESFGISYTDTGDGIPVLLLHGFGEDSRIFDEQVSFLKGHYRVIVPDLPASGNSLPIGPDFQKQVSKGLPASIDQMAEAMAALMNSLGLEKYILLGHSMGGYISLALAEKHASNLAALGLIHSTAFPDSEEKKASRRSGIDLIAKNGGFAFLQTAIPGLFSETFKKEQPGRVASLIEQFNPAKTGKSTLDQMLTAYYEAMIARPDRTHVLKSSKVPVLFIIGTEDKAVPMADILKQVHLPSTAMVHIIENTAHMSMMENTSILNGHLLKFLRDIQYSRE